MIVTALLLLFAIDAASGESPVMQDVVYPFLARHQAGKSGTSPSSNPLELDREMRVVARHISQLGAANFNREVLLPLQQLYVERREWRPAISPLMQMIESEVAGELREDQTQSWYGDVIDGPLAFGGYYALAHMVGRAVVKTERGQRLVARARNSNCIDKLGRLFDRLGSAGPKAAPPPGKVPGPMAQTKELKSYHFPLDQVGGGNTFKNWVLKKWGHHRSFALGLGMASGAGLAWGTGEALYHELSDRKLSPQKLLSQANQYLALRHTFTACSNYGKALELKQQMPDSEQLSPETLEERQQVLRQWQERLQQMGVEAQELDALAPELSGGVPAVDLTGSFTFIQGEEACKLQGDGLTVISTRPIYWHLQQTDKVLAPLYERYLP